MRITGWISSDQVRDEILAARALVLPSFAEGLPVVIMEAMALRRPVISTFVAGIPELVHDGENGWLVPAGDVDALADAMIDCLAAAPPTRWRAWARRRASGCWRATTSTSRRPSSPRCSPRPRQPAVPTAATAERHELARRARPALLLVLGAGCSCLPPCCCVQLLAAVVARRRVERGAGAAGARARTLAVLMPAHDEAGGIAAAIARRPAATRRRRPSAGRRRQLQRRHRGGRPRGRRRGHRAPGPERRGKGYALDHGVRQLEPAPPDVVVIVDADCIARAGQRSIASRALSARDRRGRCRRSI